MEKKEWIKPELVILLRGTPEEAILANCRNATMTTASGATTYKANCKMNVSTRCSSTLCSALNSS